VRELLIVTVLTLVYLSGFSFGYYYRKKTAEIKKSREKKA